MAAWPHTSAALVLVLSLGCATTGDSISGEPEAKPQVEKPLATSGRDEWAKRKLSELEQRLQQAKRVEIEFEIQSEGVVDSQLSGRLVWERDGMIELVATGEFTGQPQELGWRGDAETLTTLVAGEERWTGERPEALIEAVVIGLTRQGLLHNLAVLVGGLPPDHADGKVQEWLTIVDPQLGPSEYLAGEEATPLDFGIEVEQSYVGRATLWLDMDGLPKERHQTVHLKEGEMKVVERYVSVIVED